MPQDNWPVWAQFALFPCKIGEGALYFFMDEDCGLQAAERLLACYEPGPVVKVDNSDGTCHHCGLWNDSYYGGCSINLSKHGSYPGPDCPGAGTYKLTPVEVDDAAL